MKIDSSVRDQVLAGIFSKLAACYVFPEVAKTLIDALGAYAHRGDYDAIDDGDTFAQLLGEQLRALSQLSSYRPLCL